MFNDAQNDFGRRVCDSTSILSFVRDLSSGDEWETVVRGVKINGRNQLTRGSTHLGASMLDEKPNRTSVC